MLPGNSATHLAPTTTPILPGLIAIAGMACRFPTAPAAERPLAGVGSFGISGTNVHVVLEGMQSRAGSTPANPERAMLLPLSARSPQALRDHAATYAEFPTEADQAGPEFVHTCYTASVRRIHHEHRIAVVAHPAGKAAEQLVAYGESENGAAARAAGGTER